MSHLRKLARDWTDGFRAARDVLLWGHAYPRAISLQELRRMRR
ncbi:hypothetical protein ABZ650_20535 [Streptomyces griseoviridis]